ncbi:MAG: 50S ribosomal protein L29 [Candidatus Brocadiia bacterium]
MNRHLREIHELDSESLKKQVNDLRKDLFMLRYKAVTDQLERNTDFRNTRRKIARILTVLRERELGVRGGK